MLTPFGPPSAMGHVESLLPKSSGSKTAEVYIKFAIERMHRRTKR
jgi:hypothetical protein